MVELFLKGGGGVTSNSNKCKNKDVVLINQNDENTKLKHFIFSLVSLELRISLNTWSW